MNQRFVFPLLLVFSLFFQACTTQKKTVSKEAFEDSLLWKISGNGLEKPSYLFGTFHILCKEDLLFTPTLEQALAQSDELFLEVDLTDTMQLMSAMGGMMMKDGKKLRDLLSAEQYQKVSDEFKSIGMGISSLERMQPFLLSGMIIPKWFNCKEQSGVEVEILKLAKQYKKKVNGLETLNEQLGFFSAIPYQKQAEELYKMFEDEKAKAQMQELYQAYLQQKLSSVVKIMNSEDQMVEFKETLLNERNRNWVVKLKEIMPKKSAFVAVGAGHLLDTEGLVPLLRKEGYTVEPVL